jgi:hypothetical protein
MSFIKKSDVKNHLSSRNRNGIHLYKPASQPDATGFSGEQSGRADSSLGNVVETTPNLPSSRGQDTSPAQAQPDSNQLVTITESKSARV